jgi:DNA modification methylase
MAKKYTGSLSLEWFNKQKSILVQAEELHINGDIPAPKINWINKDEALFYEIVDDEGKGLSPYWVDRSDLRVKEARPLVFQKTYKAVEKTKPGTFFETEYELVESNEDESAIDNMLIRGDNLLALNALKKLFENRPDEEKVKCIFIDPPYNTGAAFEQYDDNLAHSEWLTLTRDRLEVLKQLLSQSGSIWITIDDVECHYLKILCDEVFGQANFVANVIWEKVFASKNSSQYFSVNHDHVLVYAYSLELWQRNLFPRDPSQTADYKNPDDDPRGVWISVALSARNYYSLGEWSCTTPSGRFISGPPKGRYWTVSPNKFRELCEDKRIWWGKEGDGVPRRKVFLSEVQDGIVPTTIWSHEEAGNTQEAKKETIAVTPPDEEVFSTPKPEKLLSRILTVATNEGDLVLDCFGGSGTTFSVAQKMNRRWIGVEIGIHANTHIIPRLKKVLIGEDQTGISKAVNWQGGGGFKYYTLGESIIDHTTRDFNWKLGRDFIEKSLLSSYDFAPNSEFTLPQAELIATSRQPAIGFHQAGQKQMACVVSLVEPNEDKPISYDELIAWYDTLKKFQGTQSITVFTNRGVEMAYDSKPDDLEVIKVPHAIFAELEK